MCEKRQPANKEPPPQQIQNKCKEGATWHKYCMGVNSTPRGVRDEKGYDEVARWANPRASIISQGKFASRENGVLPRSLENDGALGHILVSVGLT